MTLAGAPCERPGWIKVSWWWYVTWWTGRQTEDLNPCLEQSRSQAAGKLSSVPSSASSCPLSHTERSGHVMVDIIALSSIYPFPLPLSEVEVTRWNAVTREQCMDFLLSKSPTISVSSPEANVRLAVLWQYSVRISGSAFLSATCIGSSVNFLFVCLFQNSSLYRLICPQQGIWFAAVGCIIIQNTGARERNTKKQ